MVDETRLLTATALTVEDKAIDATLEAVFVVRKGIKVETDESLAVAFA